jgi:hypothetical protein
MIKNVGHTQGKILIGRMGEESKIAERQRERESERGRQSVAANE